jgi:hypothetical protein
MVFRPSGWHALINSATTTFLKTGRKEGVNNASLVILRLGLLGKYSGYPWWNCFPFGFHSHRTKFEVLSLCYESI